MKTDLHPEELLDRDKLGALSVDEAKLLEEHCHECPACAFSRDFAAENRIFSNDDEMLARIVGAASAQLGIDESMASRRSPLARRRVAVTAAILFAAASAMALVVSRTARSPEPARIAPMRAIKPRLPLPSDIPAATAPIVQAPSAGVLPAVNVLSTTQSAHSNEPERETESRRADNAPTLTAAELFSRANAARRTSDGGEASRWYRQLQRRYPGSREEIMSRVTFGRFLLDRMNDSPGAIAQFNSYLSRAAHGPLAEEALIGLAIASGRLHHDDAERTAWEHVLRDYPNSMYAPRARQRLSAMH